MLIPRIFWVDHTWLLYQHPIWNFYCFNLSSSWIYQMLSMFPTVCSLTFQSKEPAIPQWLSNFLIFYTSTPRESIIVEENTIKATLSWPPAFKKKLWIRSEVSKLILVKGQTVNISVFVSIWSLLHYLTLQRWWC